MTAPPRTYSYDQLAARIEEVLGERPSKSSLRAAASAARRTHTSQSRPRITYGMPSPEPATSRTAPARFCVDKIEAWLYTHPRLAWQTVSSAYRHALRDPAVRTEAAVRLAREAGLTWTQITQGLHDERADTRTRAGVHKAYRYLDPGP